MTVQTIDKATPELLEAVNRLLPQLSSSASAMTPEGLERFISQPNVHLFVYTPDDDPNNILGMLTLVIFHIPTGTRAWIEDVVVSEETRGQGAGRKLTEAALEYANSLGTCTVDLTSRPSREAANRLYQRVGFDKRNTNVYRYSC
ncbi:MAG: GNAT family N-acetyltransferase [Actinomycetaceae bacterium]|nr:GNAT family N-acetyltransferase [Actinomycetaceae bacterium]